MNVATNIPVEVGPQALLDATIQHLFKQGRPARSDSGQCRYLTEKGETCAVGCHLLPGEYDPTMDDQAALGALTGHYQQTGISILVMAGLLPKRLIPHEAMLRRLQRLHDMKSVLDHRGAFVFPKFKPFFEEVAEFYDLDLHWPEPAFS